MAQITQTNAAGCIISQRKTGWVIVAVVAVLGFVCDNLRDLREILGVRLCGLLESSCVLFSRRLRRSRRGMQQAALFRRERQFGVNVVIGVHLRYMRKSAGDIGVSSVYID